MKLVIPNAVPLTGSESALFLSDIDNELFTVTTVDAVATASTRSVGYEQQMHVHDDQLVEVTLDDGTRWYLGADEQAELLSTQPSTLRGEEKEKEKTLVLDASVFGDRTSRGLISQTIKRVKVFTLDLLPNLADEATTLAQEQLASSLKNSLVSLAIDPIAFGIARRLEKKLTTKGVSRLCRVVSDAKSIVKLKPMSDDSIRALVNAKEPTLLLLHGTLSSTEGSFGDLWRARPDEYQLLVRYYGERIIALEHCTLTESPVANALQVANALPDNSRLHILSHSRGGLVGELLCRGTRVAEAAFYPDEIESFKAQQSANKHGRDVPALVFDALKQHYKQELQNLELLNHRLTDMTLVIDRFVRVGCPARGTTLASGKLHRWSNRAFNAVGILGGQSLNPVFEAFQAFTLAALKSNTKAEVLPGLQAQMPTSALIHVLNNSQAVVPADLSVVAGDIEIQNRWNWKRVPLWLTDRFYGGSNDLVVNTASMDGGAKREAGMVALQVVGDHVNHFSYFGNADSASQLVQRLIGRDTPRFELFSRPQEVHIPRSASVQHTGNRPALLLIPGILGSELESNGKKIWVHALSLLRGDITKLSIENKPPEISAPALMEKAYGAFIQRMSQSHDVHVCPYDWRQSLTDSAKSLAKRITEILEQQEAANDNQTIRIVAHSMGGLVARMMIAQDRDIWDRIAARPGFRLLMAGTPTNGSYSIARIVSGEDQLIKLLALADLKHSKQDITKLLSRFPGVASLLPDFGELEWLQPETWKNVNKGTSNKHWSIVPDELLTLVRQERQLLHGTQLNPETTGYVAGQSDKTAVDVFPDKTRDNKLCFRYSREGDGQVSWASGIPTGLSSVWFQPSAHGSLLADPEHFQAWEQLLQTGRTGLLPKSPASGRSRASEQRETWTEEDSEFIDYLPDEDTLLELALGMNPRRRPAPGSQKALISLSVAHGDLAFAHFPVAVGHYKGDSILHAERALDRQLKHRLTERQTIGQYPGEIGSNEVVFSHSDRSIPEGAVIMGLGPLGELSAATLEHTLTNGIINYIFELNEWWTSQRSVQEPPVFGLSALLIGSGIGTLSVRDSVGVLMRAACEANRAFQERPINSFLLLQHIEIVELWQDLALEAVDMALQWKAVLPQISVNPELQTLEGGRQRSRFTSSTDWWHTISVKLSEDKTAYLYDNYTRFARNELTEEPIDRNFVDRFLERIIHSTHYDRQASSSPQQALFQLLLPRSIKEKAPDSDKLLLVLDEATARIPWEMLVDGWAAERKEPLAVTKTVVRRLSLENVNFLPQRSLGKEALVVGDPPSGSDPYPELPGAQQEARSVARLLQTNRQYTVTSIISDDSTDRNSTEPAMKIIQALYSQEFRILHFAGHGSYYRETGNEKRDREDEGMIIGEGLRLTPTLINKMPRTPTLVFLNCCHLGLVEQRNDQSTVRYNHIAANLACQFVRLGTQVVVAAGWEVEDAAAKRFAEVFYDNILANQTLGHAINQARTVTYNMYPDTNTFGAYQCWGDPEFRLDPRRGSVSNGLQRNGFVSASECELEALNIRNAAMSAKSVYRDSLELRADYLMDQIVSTYGDPWTSPDIRKQTGEIWDRPRTRVLARLGWAYGELGRIDLAVRLLRAAIRLNPAALSLHDLEQLGNFECRYAVEVHTAALQLTPELGSAKRIHGAGKARLKRLFSEYERSGQNATLREIHCLLGSAAKRLAMLQDKGAVTGIIKALEDMRYHYGTGWAGDSKMASTEQPIEAYIRQAAINQEPPDQYAFLNFAQAIVVARWFTEGSQSALPETLVDQVRILSLEAKQADNREESFWEAVQLADIMLLQHLDDSLRKATGVFDDNVDFLSDAKSIYEKINRRFGSVKQWASVLDQLEFFRLMIEKKPENLHQKRDEEMCEVIDELKKCVTGLLKT